MVVRDQHVRALDVTMDGPLMVEVSETIRNFVDLNAGA